MNTDTLQSINVDVDTGQVTIRYLYPIHPLAIYFTVPNSEKASAIP